MKVLAIILFSLLFQFSFAQDLHFQTFSNLNEVNDVTIDHDTLWVATTGGVQKRLIDGTLLDTYTVENGLQVNSIESIFIDDAHNKWFCARNIITKFDNKNFTGFEVPDSLIANNSIVTLVVDQQENVWFGLSDRALKYDGKSYTPYLKSDPSHISWSNAKDMVIDSVGRIWFNSNPGVTMFDGVNWMHYNKDNGLPDNTVNALSIDGKGNLWAATSDGLAYFDGEIWHTISLDNVPSKKVYDIFATEDKIWAGTQNGLIYFDGILWRTALPGLIIDGVVADRNGKVWFHERFKHDLFSLGINGQITAYSVPSPIAGNNVFDITSDKTGAIWFATDNGASKYDGNQWTSYHLPDEYASNSFRGIAVDSQNQIWIAAQGNVSKYDGETWTTFYTEDGLASINTSSIAIDLQGNIWVGTWDKGVMMYDGSTWKNYTMADGLISDYVTKVAVDNNNRIIASGDDGISIYDGDTWTSKFINPSGVPATDIVDALFVDDENKIWTGLLRNGIQIVTEDSVYEYYNVEGSDTYFSDLLYKENSLYALSIRGFSIVKDSTWKDYNYKEGGLPSTNLISLFIDSNNNLWIGGSGGLAVTKLDENHAPTAIQAASDTFSIKSSNTLITRLLTEDEDSSDIHSYKILPEPNTDFEYVVLLNDEIWLKKNLPENKNSLTLKLRSTDLGGTSIDQTLVFRVNVPEVVTSVEEPLASKIKVYPVPTQDKVQLEGMGESAKILLYDITGKQLPIPSVEKSNQLTTINLQSYPKGIYILKIGTRDHWETLKILKKE